MQPIILGADHAATELKEQLKHWLEANGYAVEDVSPTEPEGGDDYPDYAFLVGEKVVAAPNVMGLLLCDTGVGIAIAANKVVGVRAALVQDTFAARRAREHNDANVLVLGSAQMNLQTAQSIVQTFLDTAFSRAERHTRRLGKISYYDTYRQRPDTHDESP